MIQKRISFVALYFLLCTPLFSQNQFDTLSIKSVAKGVKHLSIVEPNVPWTLNVLKIDLSESLLKIESVIARDKVTELEQTSSMSFRYNGNKHHVVGAVNGGFFDATGRDVGMQIREGEIVTPNNNWSAIGFDINKTPFIERLSLQSKIILNDGNSFININGINKLREENQLIFFNSYYGSSTRTNQYGTEVVIEPLTDWLVNDTVKCVVSNKVIGEGNINLVVGKAVLSGHGTSKDFLDANINIGDTLFIVHSIPEVPNTVSTLLNGYPKIVSNGVNCALACYADEGGSTTFATARHPRTAAGFSEDKRFLYLVTVDGRQTISAGMSLPELADFLVGIGVYRAVNLDGGGSTTMVVRNSIANSPSDAGGERSVANSLMVVSLDTKGTLSQIRLNTEYAKVFANNTYQFSVGGFDEYFNSISINSSDVTYSVSNNIGTIDNDGVFTASGNPTTGYVIAEYNGMKDSALVKINSIVKLKLTPELAVTDTINQIQFNVKAFDIYGWEKQLSIDSYNWYSTNPFVGIIDSLGNFQGVSSGETKIIVKWGDVSDTANVDVELKEGKIILNHFDNLNEWEFSGESIDTSKSYIELDNNKYTEGGTSVKLNYSFTYQTGGQHWAYLNCNIPISGVPLNFEIDVNSNNYKHMIAFIVTNYLDEEFALTTNKAPDIDEYFDTLQAVLNKPIPLEPTNVFYYPITLKKIAILLNSDRVNGTTYEGEIYFDNLRVNYSDPIVSVNSENEIPNLFQLFQNYPNPFNPSTVIKYSIPTNESRKSLVVSLKIYDILGREVKTLVKKEQQAGNYEVTFDAENLTSGFYIYTLHAGSFSQSKKMILLK